MTVAISPTAPRLMRTRIRTIVRRTARGWISISRPPGSAKRWSMPTGIRVSMALTGSYCEYWNTSWSFGTQSWSRTGSPHPLWSAAGGTPAGGGAGLARSGVGASPVGGTPGGPVGGPLGRATPPGGFDAYTTRA
jgi:hypothetical protein